MKPVFILESMKFALIVLLGVSYAAQSQDGGVDWCNCEDVQRILESGIFPRPPSRAEVDCLAEKGNRWAVERIYREFNVLPSKEALTRILSKSPDDRGIVPFAVKRDVPLESTAYTQAIEHGNVKVVEAAIKKGAKEPTSTKSMERTVRRGYGNTFGLLNKEYGFCPNQESLGIAAKFGYHETLMAVYDACGSRPEQKSIDEAYEYNTHRPFFQEPNPERALCPSQRVFEEKVKAGDWETVRFCEETCGLVLPQEFRDRFNMNPNEGSS